MRRSVANSLSWMAADDGARLQVAALKRTYSDPKRATHREVGPCQTYNCHGLTFASRRTGISRSSEIQAILQDDGYARIDFREVMPGDIVIYRQSASLGGEIHHSGIVVERPPPIDGIPTSPKVLSKWGHSHEVIHDVAYCEYYQNATIEYYRIAK